MCGIVGYVGPKEAAPILLQGLKGLEYRGYDSAGVALLNGSGVQVVKRPGKLSALAEAVDEADPRGTCGIAHTRWATHGVPNQPNAHPHTSSDGEIALVHNGIIENAESIRMQLLEAGYVFASETDTEVVVHLIDHLWTDGMPMEDAVSAALRSIDGAYSIAVVSSRDPNKIVVARDGSPLLIGVGKNGEMLAGSDAAAVIALTRQVVYLDDGDYAVLEPEGYRTYKLEGTEVSRSMHQVTWDVEAMEKGGYEHFMLKEIFEQPASLRDVMRGRLLEEEGDVRLGGIENHEFDLGRIRRIVTMACGTSWHAGLVGYRQQVQHGVGRAAHRQNDHDGVLERLPVQDVPGLDVLLQQIVQHRAGTPGDLLVARVDRRDRRRARHGHPQSLDRRGHGVCGEHPGAGALPRAGDALHREQVFQ